MISIFDSDLHYDVQSDGDDINNVLLITHG